MTSKLGDQKSSRAEKAVEAEKEEANTNVSWVIALICVAWVAFQVYTAVTGVKPALQQRSIHLFFALLLVFTLAAQRYTLRSFKGVIALSFAALSTVSTVYIAANHLEIASTTGNFTVLETSLAIVLIICTLEAARRIIGWAIPIIAVVAMGYAYFGANLGGPFFHSGYNIEQITVYQALGLQGVFGTALGVIASFVFLFILYAALLQITGAGQLFIDLATALFGTIRGGPAKIAVAASAAFGSISGSAVANVATTGPITIPLMRQVGFRRRFAGAVEATASAGGQFTPPMMGASAFLIAEVLAIPFYHVAIAAAIPAALYFIAVFMTVDIEAQKHDIKGLPRAELPSIKEPLMKGWPLLVSPLVLVFLLVVVQYSPMRAAIYTIGATIIATFLNKATRLSLKQYADVSITASKGSLEVSIACASVGIIVGTFTQTGLGFQLSGILIDAAMGNVFLLLVLTMLTSIVLGMGLPTVAAYLVLSVTVAPALIEFGLNPIGAHLFTFYFGALSAITPPVALASMVAASISKDNIWTTSFEGVRIALAAFIIPYIFVFNPGVILEDMLVQGTVGVLSALTSMYLLAAGTGRYFYGRRGWLVTSLLLALSGVLIVPNMILTLSIVSVVVVVDLALRLAQRRKTAQERTA